MTTTIPTIGEVWEVFSEAIGVPLVLAGGSVRDHMLKRTPRDFDLFALKDFPKKRLAGFERGPESFGYGAFKITNLKWRGWPVQVMGWRGHRTPEALIHEFDWSCNLFGYAGSNIIELADIDHVRPNGTLRLNNVSGFPDNVLRRGFRFCERFQMSIARADLAKLCGKIVENFQHSGAASKPALARAA